MIGFKDNLKIKPNLTIRHDFSHNNEDSDYIVFNFPLLTDENMYQLFPNSILPGLFSNSKDDIMRSLDSIKYIPMKYIDNESFGLAIQRILFFIDPKESFNEIIEIDHEIKIKALDCLNCLLTKTNQTLIEISKFNIVKIICYQLPLPEVPQILRLLLQSNNNFLEDFYHEIDYLNDICDQFVQKLEGPAILETLSLFFEFDNDACILPKDMKIQFATKFIYMLNNIFMYQTKDKVFSLIPSRKLFEKDLFFINVLKIFSRINKKEYLEILANTDFLKIVINTYSTYYIKDTDLMQKLKLSNDSVQYFILQILKCYIDAQLSSELIKYNIFIFLNEALKTLSAKSNENSYLHNNNSLYLLFEIAKGIASISDETRLYLLYSDFHSSLHSMHNSMTTNGKSYLLSYIISFVSFDINMLENLSNTFDLVSLISDCLFGDFNSDLINELLDFIFNLISVNDDLSNLNELSNQITLFLRNEDNYNSLISLAQNSSNADVSYKSGLILKKLNDI